MEAVARLQINKIAPKERHTTIFRQFDVLALDEFFIIVVDHDPRPLYFQFLFDRTGEFDWMHLRSGPDVWEIRIQRIRNPKGEGKPPEKMKCGCGGKNKETCADHD